MRVRDAGDSHTQMLLAVLGQESEERGPCLGWGWTHFPEGFMHSSFALRAGV